MYFTMQTRVIPEIKTEEALKMAKLYCRSILTLLREKPLADQDLLGALETEKGENAHFFREPNPSSLDELIGYLESTIFLTNLARAFADR